MAGGIEEVAGEDVVIVILGAIEESHEVAGMNEPCGPSKRENLVGVPRGTKLLDFVSDIRSCGTTLSI